MRKYLYIFIVIFIFNINTSNADDTNEIGIGYSFFTYHIHQKDHHNEKNHGVILSINNIFISTFNNSHYNRSWFGGYSFQTKKKEINKIWLRGKLHIGPLYGYEDDMPNFEGWTIGAAPAIEFGIKKVALETIICPAQGGVIASMIKIYF